MKFFRKDVPYDNFKSHKKPGFHHLFRRYNFQKTTGEGGQIDPPSAVLGLSLPLLLNLHHLTVIPTRQYTPTLFSYQLFSNK